MQQSARAVTVPRCKERHRSITELMVTLESAETASSIRRCTNATDRLEVPIIIIDLLIFCSVDLVLLNYVNRSPSSRSSHAEVGRPPINSSMNQSAQHQQQSTWQCQGYGTNSDFFQHSSSPKRSNPPPLAELPNNHQLHTSEDLQTSMHMPAIYQSTFIHQSFLHTC